jgi:hypothetical protein
MLINNALGSLVVDRAGKHLPCRISAIVWRTHPKMVTETCRVRYRLANQNGPMQRANAGTGPHPHAIGARNG